MSTAERAEARTVSARLWDWPTRVVHWALVILIAFAWWSSEDHLNWHRWAGYGVIGLVVFRILWGFAGSRTAQFASFVKGPGKTLAYLRTLPNRDPTDVPGHNPLGAWSVVAILLSIAAVVGLGLFTVDIDAFEGGPLSDRVSFELGRRIAEWHELAFRVLQGLVVLHVAAVAYYLVWKRSNLITPMFTGRKAFRTDPGLSFAPLWRTLLVALVAAAVAWWIAKGARF